MPAAGRTWKNPRTGAWITWLPDGGDGVIERVMKPHTGKADAHLHLDFVESYEVIDGTATVERDGERLTLGAGERLEIQPGTRHRNPYNETGSDLRLRHRVSPGGAFAEAFVSSLGHHTENDTVNAQGEFPQLQLFATLHATRAQSFLAGPPIALQKPVIWLGALIARARGYQPSYD
jgi:mannose-6-phosphate isomerase-like protein (cupin superfamily)